MKESYRIGQPRDFVSQFLYDHPNWYNQGKDGEKIEDGIIDLVGTDDLPETHYVDRFLFEEKASVRIWGFFVRENEKMIKKLFKQSLLSQFHDPAQEKRTLIKLYLPYSYDPYYYDPSGRDQNKNIYNQIKFN